MNGRDIEEEELMLSPDPTTHIWNIVGNSQDLELMRNKKLYSANPIIITIKKLLEASENNCIELTSTELYHKILEITKVRPKEKNAAAITKSLAKLQYDMLEYDGIHYTPPPTNGGASGRKMHIAIIVQEK